MTITAVCVHVKCEIGERCVAEKVVSVDVDNRETFV